MKETWHVELNLAVETYKTNIEQMNFQATCTWSRKETVEEVVHGQQGVCISRMWHCGVTFLTRVSARKLKTETLGPLVRRLGRPGRVNGAQRRHETHIGRSTDLVSLPYFLKRKQALAHDGSEPSSVITNDTSLQSNKQKSLNILHIIQ